ncbi:F-box only protein 33 [Armadillidium vulgare]|nr:F-box only protein 33 [Armadillidium vulgare]
MAHFENYTYTKTAYECLQNIITSTKGLKTLTLGCLQDITELADELLPLLGSYHSTTLSTLGLASVKSDPNSYALLHITPEHFASFSAIQVLTVDYDYVNDEFLQVLTKPFKAPLRRLVLHIHGIDPSHRGTSELAWHNFRNYNQQCSLVLNLLYSYEGVEQLNSGLLRQSMPLSTFRAFFCEWLVDALDNRAWSIFSQHRGEEQNQPPDPLVMLAWRCKRLIYLSLIGYSYSATNLVAIARLRGSALNELIIPEDFLEGDDPREPLTKEEIENLSQDVSTSLDRSWAPVKLSSLHPSLQAVGNPDSDELILSHILKDAQPF